MKWLLLLCLALAAGCTSESPAPSADPSSPTSSAPVPSASASASPESQSRVLARIDVTRRGDELGFAALWVWGNGRSHRELVIGTGDDVRRVEAPHDGDVTAAFPIPEPTQGIEASQVLGRLLTMEVPSLRPGTRVVLGGGDGATLFPFQKVAVSQEYDDWSVVALPRFGGEMAYTSGGVVLADGRLLVLLDHFGDDRAGRPSDRHHGLWISRSGDVGSYRPFEPRFVPPLTRPAGGWGPLVGIGASLRPDPVIHVSTWDHRVYASTDGGRTFREIDVR